MHRLSHLDARGLGVDGLPPAETAARPRGVQACPGSFLDEPPLELREGGEDLEDELAGGRGRVDDTIADRTETNPSLPQQLVRSRLQPRSRTFVAKLREAYWALRLERVLSKQKILEAYVNTASFGHQTFGIAAAAKTYFGKSPQELSLPESAFLIGLVQSPSAYDPFAHMAAAKKRQALVLRAMEATNLLTPLQRSEAEERTILLAPDRTKIQAPHFVLSLLQTRADELPESGEVRTTIDLPLQTRIEKIVEHHLSELQKEHVSDAAVVVLDAHTGDILAMIGSANYFDEANDGAVNVAISPRQPGSTVKPFTYALALIQGDTAATTVADVQAQFFTREGNPYTPRNYDYNEHGLVRYREALANSYNIAAVKILQRVGVDRLLGLLRDAGTTTLTQTPDHYGLALTLGDAEMSLWELSRAYGTFARAGDTLVTRSLFSDPIPSGRQILGSSIAWLITNILSDPRARIAEFGEAGPLAFDWPVAAKTGTTRNARDNWTIGYTPDRIVGAWVGNADNMPMRNTSGITGAGPIFHDAMVAATQGRPHPDFPKTANIVTKTVCRLSGKLPSSICPDLLEEFFIRGTEPKEIDDLYRNVSIDRRNGLLANASCDSRFVERRTFVVFPPELQSWSRQNGWPQMPPAVSSLCSSRDSSNASSTHSRWLSITHRKTVTASNSIRSSRPHRSK